MKEKNTRLLIQKIQADKIDGKFNKYINKIIFPFYKNFQNFSSINFQFPLTVLVGKNGTGKSSILHALYGCPYHMSTKDYWFSTDIDPIKDSRLDLASKTAKDDGKLAQSYVYTYDDTNEHITNAHVLKTRAKRSGTKTKEKDPDYWEPATPKKKYGMDINLARFSPIKEKVIYMDFRVELSAYDKYFYFENTKTKGQKQKYIRSYPSKRIKRILDAYDFNQKVKKENKKDKKGKKKIPLEPEIIKFGKKVQNEKLIWLSDEMVKNISYILGNNYHRIRIIPNKFFKNWGYTVLLQRDTFAYTEANAGSGEFAVVMLVFRLMTAENEDGNLILLDEPETSLFPGAQSRLLEFLLEYIKKSHNQVIISTHSTSLVQELPNEAIKRVIYNKETYKTSIDDSCSPSVAFSELESPGNKYKIFTEDDSAKILVESCLNPDQKNIFSINACNNGFDTMQRKNIYTNALENNNKTFYILDGDRLNDYMKDFLQLNDIDLEKVLSDYNDRQKLISNLGFEDFPFRSNKPRKSEKEVTYSIQDDPTLEKSQCNYLRFYHSNVSYLPKENKEIFANLGTPESIVLSDYIIKIGDPLELKISLEEISKTDQIKAIIRKIVKKRTGSYSTVGYNQVMQELCTQWVKKKDTSFKEIQKILIRIQNDGKL